MVAMQDTPPAFDVSSFNNEAYVRRIDKPWGWELHWTPENLPYMGKVIHINAGARLSLQLHDEKRESWMVMRGRAKVAWEDNAGDADRDRAAARRRLHVRPRPEAPPDRHHRL